MNFQVLGLSTQFDNRTIPIEDGSLNYQLRELNPGATYQVQAFTVFDGKDSVAYTSRNFTTSMFLKCLRIFFKIMIFKFFWFWVLL